MEPRPYQAEAFDAARKDNVVMVGATGVGKVNQHRSAVDVAVWRRRRSVAPASVFGDWLTVFHRALRNAIPGTSIIFICTRYLGPVWDPRHLHSDQHNDNFGRCQPSTNNGSAQNPEPERFVGSFFILGPPPYKIRLLALCVIETLIFITLPPPNHAVAVFDEVVNFAPPEFR